MLRSKKALDHPRLQALKIDFWLFHWSEQPSSSTKASHTVSITWTLWSTLTRKTHVHPFHWWFCRNLWISRFCPGNNKQMTEYLYTNNISLKEENVDCFFSFNLYAFLHKTSSIIIYIKKSKVTTFLWHRLTIYQDKKWLKLSTLFNIFLFHLLFATLVFLILTNYN